jgi:hypothetical protein
LPIEIDRDGSIPLGRCDVFNPARGPRDARIVDQHIEPSVTRLELVEGAIDLIDVTDVTHAAGGTRMFGNELLYRLRIDVSHMHATPR